MQQARGEQVSTSRNPLLYVSDSWEVMSMLALLVPRIDHRTAQDGDERTVWMPHRDGSWARATAAGFLDSPTVHQGGPRRLWEALERVRHRLNREGGLLVCPYRKLTPPATQKAPPAAASRRTRRTSWTVKAPAVAVATSVKIGSSAQMPHETRFVSTGS